MDSPRTIVVALGGNALARAGDDGTIEMQYRRADAALAHVATLAAEGCCVVLTHGNGPVVGRIVLRGELAAEHVPPTPLYIAGADSEGGIGLMLQQVLGNHLRAMGDPATVATVVTQVVVDEHDPAFLHPSKPIGPYYTEAEAQALAADRMWSLAPEPRGWRRTVASPRPTRVVETPAVRALLDARCIPIAAGGGGVPVVERTDGSLAGVDAVIDKDWTSAVLAAELRASTLAILMESDAVYEDWGGPHQRRIEEIAASDVQALLESRAFSAGSIRPKLEAAAWFTEQTGSDAIICATEALEDALAGGAGTRVTAR